MLFVACNLWLLTTEKSIEQDLSSFFISQRADAMQFSFMRFHQNQKQEKGIVFRTLEPVQGMTKFRP